MRSLVIGILLLLPFQLSAESIKHWSDETTQLFYGDWVEEAPIDKCFEARAKGIEIHKAMTDEWGETYYLYKYDNLGSAIFRLDVNNSVPIRLQCNVYLYMMQK